MSRGKHQELGRADAQGAKRVDLFIDLHGAELRREGGPGAPGHDDRSDERSHLAHRADPDEVRHVDLGAEHAELRGCEERDRHADERGEQTDDRERIGAAQAQQEH